MSIGMYPRVGAPLVPDVLSPVLGCERVSSRVLSELGLPLGMRLEQLDERVWVDLGLDAGLALGHDVLGCVRSPPPECSASRSRSTPSAG